MFTCKNDSSVINLIYSGQLQFSHTSDSSGACSFAYATNSIKESSLFLKNMWQSTLTLQLFTITFKTESIYESY